MTRKTGRMSDRRTTTLNLTLKDVEILLGIVGFASESETYADQDEQLDRMWKRLERAASRIAGGQLLPDGDERSD